MKRARLAAQSRVHLEERLRELGPVSRCTPPVKGWISALRQALGMTAEQLGRRLGVKQSSVILLEQSEAKGSIELATLRRAAEALDCTLVYAFVPKKSLEETVRARAISSTDASPPEERAELIPAHIAYRAELNAARSRTTSPEAKIGHSPVGGISSARNSSRIFHHRMLGDVWRWAGKFRTTERNLGIHYFEISIAVRELLQDAKAWVEETPDGKRRPELKRQGSGRSGQSSLFSSDYLLFFAGR